MTLIKASGIARGIPSTILCARRNLSLVGSKTDLRNSRLSLLPTSHLLSAVKKKHELSFKGLPITLCFTRHFRNYPSLSKTSDAAGVEKNSLHESLLKTERLKKHIELARRKLQKTREEESLKHNTGRKPFRENLRTIYRIIKLGKPDLKFFLYALVFILFAVLYPTAAVKLVGASIDAFNANSKDEDGDLIIWGYKYTTLFAFMVPFMCVSAVCFWARIWVLKVLGERLVARLRFRVLKNLLRHDARFYDDEKNKVGDLISRLSSDAYVVSRSITSNLPDGLKNFLFGIVSSYMMYAINPLLFGVMILISPPLTYFSVRFGEKIRALSTKLQNATAGLTKVSEETLNSVKLVQAFAAEQKELDKYADKLRDVVKVAKTEAFAQSNYLVSIYSLYHTGYLACIAIGVHLILGGYMTTGDVVAFTMYLESFNMALYSLTATYMELMKGSGAGTKLFEMIDYVNDVDPVKGKKIDNFLGNDIEFRDVVFSYPTRPNHVLFQGLSFKVPASSSTCFVAPSGCGKSTIASLLLRSYNIKSGEILIGGENINDFQIRDLRRYYIGVVQQEPVLLSGTILENIVYGLTPLQIACISMNDVIHAAKQANCHDFIMTLPKGYDTLIGSRGASLSGGQKQRIAIARALVKKPLILILDEATSALDSKLEGLINETLKEVMAQGKMTIISIAHRLSTISKSENIIVLGKNGKVVEQGKFVELFSDPCSELSKLLGESKLNRKSDENKEDEEDADKQRDEEDEDLHNNEEEENNAAQEGEASQIDLVRSIIDDLPLEVRMSLLHQMSRELNVEQGPPKIKNDEPRT